MGTMPNATGSLFFEMKEEDFSSLQLTDLSPMRAVEHILSNYRSLECSVCRRHFGFVHRKDPRIIMCSSPCMTVASNKLKKTVYAPPTNIFYRPQEPANVVDSALATRGSSIRVEPKSDGANNGLPSVIHTECMEQALRSVSEGSNELEGLSEPRKCFEPCYGKPSGNGVSDLERRSDLTNKQDATAIDAAPVLNNKASQLARAQSSKGAEIGKAGVQTTEEALPKAKKAPKWFMKDLPFSPSLKDGALVYISFLKDAVTFFIRAVEDEEKVQELQAEVVTHCSQEPVISRTPVLGEILCALYNETFYRGVVLEVKEKTSSVVVDFIDYGDAQEVKIVDCREISDEIMKRHPCAYGVLFECDMSVECPSGLQFSKVPESESLDQEVVMRLRSKEENKFRGSIGIPSRKDGVTWNQILTEYILDGSKSSNKTKKQGSRFKSSVSEEPKDNGKIAVNGEPSKSKARPNDDGGEATISSNNGAPTKTVALPKQTFFNLPLSDKMKDGAEVHINFRWNYRKLCISAVEDDGNFAELQGEIAKHVETAPPFDRTPEEDDIVLAPYDGVYYRAVVSKVDGENVCVRFVDYGDDAVVQLDRLREVSPTMRRHPMYGLVAKMAGLPRKFRPDFHVEELAKVNEGIIEVRQRELDHWKVILHLGDGRTWTEIVDKNLPAAMRKK